MKAVYISPAGHGHFKIESYFYGSRRSTITSNTLATDVIKSGEKSRFYTVKQATKCLLDEIRKANFKR